MDTIFSKVRDLTNEENFSTPRSFSKSKLISLHTELITAASELTGIAVAPETYIEGEPDYDEGGFYGYASDPQRVESFGALQYFDLSTGILNFVGPKKLTEMFAEIPTSMIPGYALMELIATRLYGENHFEKSELGQKLISLVKEKPMWRDAYELFLTAELARLEFITAEANRFAFFANHQWRSLNLKRFTELDANEVKKFQQMKVEKKIEALILLSNADRLVMNPFPISDEDAFFALDVPDVISDTGIDLKGAFYSLGATPITSFEDKHGTSSDFSLEVKDYVDFLKNPLSWFESSRRKNSVEIIRRRSFGFPQELVQDFLEKLTADVSVKESFKTGSSLQKVQWLESKVAQEDYDLDEAATVYATLSKGLRILLMRRGGATLLHYNKILIHSAEMRKAKK